MNIDVVAGISVVLGVEVLAHQVSLQEEQLGEEETLQGDWGRGRGWSRLGGRHQHGEQEAGEVDKDRLENKVSNRVSTNSELKPTVNFIPAGLDWLVFYGELTGRASGLAFIVRPGHQGRPLSPPAQQ